MTQNFDQYQTNPTTVLVETLHHPLILAHAKSIENIRPTNIKQK